MVIFLSLLFATTGLTAAVLVVTSKVPMNAALFLVVTLFAVAASYVLLGAEFLAAVQVIVYAGAIMVLIIFVIQLIGFQAVKNAALQKQTPLALVVVSLVFVQIAFFTIRSLTVIASEAKQSTSTAFESVRKTDSKTALDFAGLQNRRAEIASTLLGTLSRNDDLMDHTALFSQTLFTQYLLPFETASVLLLVAIVGTVLLAQRKGIRE